MCISLPFYWNVVKLHFQQRNKAMILLHVGLIGYAAIMFITQQVVGLWWKHGFGVLVS
jgi:hypothetical protein